ncbi:MAG TPA: glycosyltransferase family 1 protein [Verrucomicrobiae bacterium]|nr:glycosyltransferase family 1 protein [Verrucomicrobiae bacterium]
MNIGVSTLMIQRGQSGVAQYVLALLRAMLPYCEENGHTLNLFVLEKDLPLFDFISPVARLTTVHEKFRGALKNIVWHQTALHRLARKSHLDVLHIPSYRRLLWRKPCPVVATVHDLAPFRVSKKYDWSRMFYGRVVVPRLARRMDQVVAVSENTAGDISRFFKLARERLTVIHNGLAHDRFFPADPAQARVWAESRHGLRHPFFLYVARLEHPAKNHVRLIEAFERFKKATDSEWQLVFAGGDWHGAGEIHSVIHRSPCAADIRSLGFVPDADLPNLYRAAGAFVYPSLFEGFGMPPIEAMACGCPVISSARGALGEVIGNAAAVIDPENSEFLMAQLCIVATCDSTRNRLRAAGLAQARKFDWNKTAAATLRVYERAASVGNP